MPSTAQTAPADVLDGNYAWLRLVISMVLATVGGAGMWAVVVVLPDVQAEFGVDRAAASLPYTATMIGFALGNMAIGRIIDRHGYWLPALVSSAALGAGFILASLSPSIALFALFQGVLIGVGSSAVFGPLIADISHWFARRRGVAVSLVAAGNYLAGAFWPSIMPPVMQAEGWRFTYAGIGIACLVVMVPLTLLLRRRVVGGAAGVSRRAPVRSLPLSPTALQAMLIVAGLGCCIAMSMPQVHIVAYCADLGFGVARGAEMLALMLAAGVVSRVVSGVLADRIGSIETLLLGVVLQGLSLFLFIPFDGLVSLYAVSFAFGLSQGGIVPCYALIVRDYMPAAEAGRRVGTVLMATIFGMAIGGWVTGWIYELTGSYTVAFLNGIGWNIMTVLVITTLFLLSRRRPTATA